MKKSEEERSSAYYRKVAEDMKWLEHYEKNTKKFEDTHSKEVKFAFKKTLLYAVLLKIFMYGYYFLYDYAFSNWTDMVADYIASDPVNRLDREVFTKIIDIRTVVVMSLVFVVIFILFLTNYVKESKKTTLKKEKNKSVFPILFFIVFIFEICFWCYGYYKIGEEYFILYTTNRVQYKAALYWQNVLVIPNAILSLIYCGCVRGQMKKHK